MATCRHSPAPLLADRHSAGQASPPTPCPAAALTLAQSGGSLLLWEGGTGTRGRRRGRCTAFTAHNSTCQGSSAGAPAAGGRVVGRHRHGCAAELPPAVCHARLPRRLNPKLGQEDLGLLQGPGSLCGCSHGALGPSPTACRRGCWGAGPNAKSPRGGGRGRGGATEEPRGHDRMALEVQLQLSTRRDDSAAPPVRLMAGHLTQWRPVVPAIVCLFNART